MDPILYQCPECDASTPNEGLCDACDAAITARRYQHARIVRWQSGWAIISRRGKTLSMGFSSKTAAEKFRATEAAA